MNSYSAQAMRNMDAETINSGICTGIDLMTRAGIAAAKKIIEWTDRTTLQRPIVFHIFTGPGNNGGDGFVIAAYLAEQFGKDAVSLHMAVPAEKLKGDALLAYQRMPDGLQKQNIGRSSIIVDCLLGTGADVSNGLREPVKSMIDEINSSGVPVIAIDIPSGICADHGAGPDGAVCAVETLTFAAPKDGLFLSAKYCGKIRVLDIGIPQTIMDQTPKGYDVFDRNAARALLKRNDHDIYKQKRGHLLVVGGSTNYPSAPFLTAEAALRAGAGLVTVAIPKQEEVFCNVPKGLIVRKIKSRDGCFCTESVDPLLELTANANAIVVGPGMTCRLQTCNFLAKFLRADLSPMVLDADALNLLPMMPHVKNLTGMVMTPHFGEMQRLLVNEPSDLNPVEKAERLCAKYNTTCVMKGPYSVTCCPEQGCTINFSGSPVLATAGSGDILSGIIGALLADGRYSTVEAVRLGVYLHGLCGEISAESVADPRFPSGVIADDLIDVIPQALRRIMPY